MSQNIDKSAVPQAESIQGAHPSGLRKKALWTIAFIAIAVLTVWAITSQNKNFSFSSFWAFLSELNPIWITAAVLTMFAYVLFEGLAIRTLCHSIGYRTTVRQSWGYSSADIYFSALTPSATGGQPASAFFMMKDGIPGSSTTAILLINLIMYTLSIFVLGVAFLLITPGLLGYFSAASRAFIFVGFGVLLLITSIFFFLLKKASVIRWMGTKFISFLAKIKIVRRKEAKLKRMNSAIDSYEHAVSELGEHRGPLFKCFLYNLLQRSSLIFVSLFTYMAAGGDAAHLLEFFGAECLVIIGYNFIPIPGGMGIADALLLDVFARFLGDSQFAANLELLSRSISFYLCVLLCGIIFLSRCIRAAKKNPSRRAPAKPATSATSDGE